MKIDPSSKQLIMDFERVRWTTDGDNKMLQEIDKSDPARSHLSDALRYLSLASSGCVEIRGAARPHAMNVSTRYDSIQSVSEVRRRL